MTDRKCQWYADLEGMDPGPVKFVHCTTGKPVAFTTCDPIGGVVCEDHKCRCSKPLPPPVTCPICGSANFTREYENASLSAPYGPEVTYARACCTCADCKADGDFYRENDEPALAALHTSMLASIDVMLAKLNADGILRTVDIERILRLPIGSLAEVKSVFVAAILRMALARPETIVEFDTWPTPTLESKPARVEFSAAGKKGEHKPIYGVGWLDGQRLSDRENLYMLFASKSIEATDSFSTNGMGTAVTAIYVGGKSQTNSYNKKAIEVERTREWINSLNNGEVSFEVVDPALTLVFRVFFHEDCEFKATIYGEAVK